MSNIKKALSIFVIFAMVISFAGIGNVNVSYADSYGDIWLDVSSLTIELEDSEDIRVYYENVDSLSFSVTGDNVIDCEWDYDYGSYRYLTVDATAVGEATLTIFDEYDTSVSVSLPITVIKNEDDDDWDDDDDYWNDDDISENDDSVVEVPRTTKTLKSDSVMSVDTRHDYILKTKMGEESTVFLDYINDSMVFLEKVTTSNKSVVKITERDIRSFDFKTVYAGKAKITVYDDEGRKSVINVTVKQGKSKIESVNYIYKKTKSVKVKVTNALKGDVIKLKIGKKTYKKKITKKALKTTVKIKIKQPGFYGKKYKLTLVRKGKTVAKKSDYVYLSDTVYVGYTKKKVRWLTFWNAPRKKNYSAYSEQWCYDWNGDGLHDAYLYFRNGKVSNWQIYN